MGIRKTEVYIIKCDICGEEVENGDGGALCLYTKDQATAHVPKEWTKKDGKLACHNCYEEI